MVGGDQSRTIQLACFMAWHHYIRGKYDDDRCLSKSQSNKIAQFTSLRAVNGVDGAAGVLEDHTGVGWP